MNEREISAFDGEPTDIAVRATRPQSLLITVYGAYSRSLGGWFAVSTILRLLGDMGIEDPAVRSALSRFKRRGILVADKRAGVASDRDSPRSGSRRSPAASGSLPGHSKQMCATWPKR